MLEALGLASCRRLVCTRAPSPRALEPIAVANAAIDLGFDADDIDIVEAIPDAVARSVLRTVAVAAIAAPAAPRAPVRHPASSLSYAIDPSWSCGRQKASPVRRS